MMKLAVIVWLALLGLGIVGFGLYGDVLYFMLPFIFTVAAGGYFFNRDGKQSTRWQTWIWLGFLTFFVLGFGQGFIWDWQLGQNGRTTIAHIDRVFYSKPIKTRSGRRLHYSYTIDGVEWERDLESDSLAPGDSIVVRYSAEYPHMFEVVGFP